MLEREAMTDIDVPSPEVDRIQEEVMAAKSPEGRPPHRRTRIAEWKWFIIGASAVGAIAMSLSIFGVIAWPTALWVGVLIFLSLAAASPTWGAGLIRGGEERKARKVALIRVHDAKVID